MMSTLGLIGSKLPVPRIDGVRARSKDEWAAYHGSVTAARCPASMESVSCAISAGYCEPIACCIGFFGTAWRMPGRVHGLLVSSPTPVRWRFRRESVRVLDEMGVMTSSLHRQRRRRRRRAAHNPRFATAASRRVSVTSHSASASASSFAWSERFDATAQSSRYSPRGKSGATAA